MSNEILYDKQFIKIPASDIRSGIEDLFLPVVLVGSNNCYDTNNKRERSWHCYDYFTKGKGAIDLNTMIEGIHTEVERHKGIYADFNSDRYGSFASLTTKNKIHSNYSVTDHINFMKTGCKKSLTIEQLAEMDITLRAFTSSYSEKKILEQGQEPFSKLIESTQDLVSILENEYRTFNSLGVHFYFTYDYLSEDKMKRVRSRFFPPKNKKVKKSVIVDRAFIISFDNGFYVSGGRKFYYSQDESSAKRFFSKGPAESKRKLLNKRWPDYNFKLETYVFDNPEVVVI